MSVPGGGGATAAAAAASPQRRIDAAERRARLVGRHRLTCATAAVRIEEATAAVVALHSSDPASVILSAAARTQIDDPVGDAERALYGDRSLVRMHGMRDTLFVVPAALAPVIYAASARTLAQRRRARVVKEVAEAAGFDAGWLDDVEASVRATLAVRGEATARELSELVPALRERITSGAGKRYEASQTVASRILRLMAAENQIARGRPLGTWVASQYRWRLAAPMPALEETDAQAKLVRCWLAAFGPGTEVDIAWWTGWPLRAVHRALRHVGAMPVRIDDGIGFVLPDDLEPAPSAAPEAALLPGLDPTPMGWKQRDWYLEPAHVAALFDAYGNVGPTVWWDGRVVGGWAQRAGGRIVWRTLATIDAEGRAAIDAQVARAEAWMGGVRVIPRFRSPLERELAA